MAGALRKRGEVGRAEEEARQAEESYRKALAIAPENAGILNRFAQFLVAGATPEKARLDKEPAGPMPADAAPAMGEGATEPREESPPESEESPAPTEDPPAQTNSSSALARERAAEAARLAAKAVEIAPEIAAFWNTLGVASYRSGDWQKSIEVLEKAPKLGAAGGPGEWLLLGMACWRLGKAQEAIQWHEKALDSIDEGGGRMPMEVLKLREEAEALLGSRELEAQRHVEAGDLVEAEEVLRDLVRFWEKLVEEDPEPKARSRHLQFANLNLGQVLKVAGRPAEAEEVYRKALAFAPDDPTCQMLLAWVLAIRPGQAKEKLTEALRLAAKAAKTAPKDARMWWVLGLTCHRLDRWTEAISALEKSLKLSQNDAPRRLLVLAMARWSLGKQEEARKSYDEACALLEKEDALSSEMQGLRDEAQALLGAERGTQ
jgi:tetratricopeptide (TPR) repeat protein